MRNQKTTVLAECAVMLALAFALSCAKLFEMPMGGSVTVASMLPIMLIGIKYGPFIGLGTAFVYSGTQILQAVVSGNVFPYCESGDVLVICILLDYLIPFTVLGLAGIFKDRFKNREIGVYVGMIGVVLVRFVCHFVTGVAIWGQWAPDGMGKYLYSLLYNGGFLSVDFIICIAIAVLMMRKKEIRRLAGLE